MIPTYRFIIAVNNTINTSDVMTFCNDKQYASLTAVMPFVNNLTPQATYFFDSSYS